MSEYYNLIAANNASDYEYWLQAIDIANIFKASYNSLYEDENIYLCSPGSNLGNLVIELTRYKYKQKTSNSQLTFTSIINLNQQHWVTLVVQPKSRSNEYRAYYCDSFGAVLSETSCSNKTNNLANKAVIIISILSLVSLLLFRSTTVTALCSILIAVCGLLLYLTNSIDLTNDYIAATRHVTDSYFIINHLEKQAEEAKEKQYSINCITEKKRESVKNYSNKLTNCPINADTIPITLKVILEIDQNDIKSSEHVQQQDGYNCGIYAIINAATITNMFKSGSSFSEIGNELSKNKLSEIELRERRKKFAEDIQTHPETQQCLSQSYCRT